MGILFFRRKPRTYRVTNEQIRTLQEQFHQVQMLKAEISQLSDQLIHAAYERLEQARGQNRD